MKQLLAAALGLLLLGHGAVAWAEESTLEQVGYGTGSVLGSAVYFPFKATFCILGGIGSGFALAFAGPDKAGEIAGATCRGTWAITPDVIKGKEQVHFVGEGSVGGTRSSGSARAGDTK